jgi:hypothetical protein
MSAPVARTTNSWMPTKKWFAALAGSAATLLAHFAATDFTFGDTEQGMIVTAASALVLAYLRRNDPTPGGVPAEGHRNY